MGFIPISISEYLKKHLKNNPTKNERDLRNRLNSALSDYKKGIKCSCGNDIWVIGTASLGTSCFSCITGEPYPVDDFEIDLALRKSESTEGGKHIDKIPPSKISGFFDDDGYEVLADFIKKPSLCIMCSNDDDPNEKVFCDMTRYDQKDEQEFKCDAYKNRAEHLESNT